MLQADGLYVGNSSGNYENKDFITFTNAEGNNTHEVNIAYQVYSNKDKGQENTYHTVSFFNGRGEFVFGIQEWSGGWAYGSDIIYATADGNETVKLPAGHMSKGGGETVKITVKFSDEFAFVSIDGGSYVAKTSAEGIKYVKLSVSGGGDQGRSMWIKNFSLNTKEIEAVQIADYKINYVCGDTILKTESKSGIVGDPITITPYQSADLMFDNKKYIYVSNDAEGKTVASDGSTVVTLTYREAPTFNYTVVTSNPESDITKGSNFEGEVIGYYFPHYLLDGNNLKENAQGGVDGQYYYGKFTLAEDNQKVVVDYKATDINNVVFYKEAEDIEGFTSSERQANRTSCGKGGYIESGKGDVVIYTMGPGTYKLTVCTRSQQRTNFVFMAGNTEVLTVESPQGNGTTATSEPFVVSGKDTPLSMKEAGYSTNLVDYLYLQKEPTFTGVEDIMVDGEVEDNRWFNLQGIQIAEPTQPGIYIHNGKKVLVSK